MTEKYDCMHVFPKLLEFQLRTCASAGSASTFASMINPKNRGQKFTWEILEHIAYTNAHTSLIMLTKVSKRHNKQADLFLRMVVHDCIEDFLVDSNIKTLIPLPKIDE